MVGIGRDSIPTRSILAAAREYSLTAYDAMHLRTVIRERLPLATHDRALASAASKAGIEVSEKT